MRRQQRVEPAGAKEVADGDPAFAVGCEYFKRIDTVFGGNGFRFWIEFMKLTQSVGAALPDFVRRKASKLKISSPPFTQYG